MIRFLAVIWIVGLAVTAVIPKMDTAVTQSYIQPEPICDLHHDKVSGLLYWVCN